ncbi:hypothetical protein ceV_103 [Chrysochromulina ericina virus CeV-01B]|uniref:Uncharacterized protein n=1 Tax=Chrysochromulina ericina virus CeV-01B TaxID=3070830 RepID=A0A0N7G7K1_9VIRU|nr:hypothetical protein ceV_103 [Chrysochromulina ericina virus]ALH23009.1 hypothetical protein ceV_103 [Chrysochromulina ericina virus CeV-01B]
MSELPSPNIGLLLFAALTIGYFIIQYKTKEKHSSIAMIVYLILLLVFQFGLNINLTKTLCGESHVKTAFFYTMFPWIFIFGLLNLMLIMFPGWLSPFSNTFGYIVVSTIGRLNNVLGEVLKSKEQTQNSELSKTLGKIYDNPSLLINEIPDATIGYEEFWHNLDKGGLLSSNAKDYYTKLQDLVRLKFIVSKFVWFALTGTLTVVTSYNYIIQAQCSSSVKEMERRHSEYQQLVKENDKTQIEPRVYSDHGH